MLQFTVNTDNCSLAITNRWAFKHIDSFSHQAFTEFTTNIKKGC